MSTASENFINNSKSSASAPTRARAAPTHEGPHHHTPDPYTLGSDMPNGMNRESVYVSQHSSDSDSLDISDGVESTFENRLAHSHGNEISENETGNIPTEEYNDEEVLKHLNVVLLVLHGIAAIREILLRSFHLHQNGLVKAVYLGSFQPDNHSRECVDMVKNELSRAHLGCSLDNIHQVCLQICVPEPYPLDGPLPLDNEVLPLVIRAARADQQELSVSVAKQTLIENNVSPCFVYRKVHAEWYAREVTVQDAPPCRSYHYLVHKKSRNPFSCAKLDPIYDLGVVFARQRTVGYSYHLFPNYDVALATIKRSKYRTWCAMALDRNVPTRPYFDVDVSADKIPFLVERELVGERNGQLDVRRFLRLIIQVIASYLGIQDSDVVAFQSRMSSPKDKVSFHLHTPHHAFATSAELRAALGRKSHLKKYVREYPELWFGEDDCCFDFVVYSKNRCFRMPHMHKVGRDNTLLPFDGESNLRHDMIQGIMQYDGPVETLSHPCLFMIEPIPNGCSVTHRERDGQAFHVPRENMHDFLESTIHVRLPYHWSTTFDQLVHHNIVRLGFVWESSTLDDILNRMIPAIESCMDEKIGRFAFQPETGLVVFQDLYVDAPLWLRVCSLLQAHEVDVVRSMELPLETAMVHERIADGTVHEQHDPLDVLLSIDIHPRDPQERTLFHDLPPIQTVHRAPAEPRSTVTIQLSQDVAADLRRLVNEIFTLPLEVLGDYSGISEDKDEVFLRTSIKLCPMLAHLGKSEHKSNTAYIAFSLATGRISLRCFGRSCGKWKQEAQQLLPLPIWFALCEQHPRYERNDALIHALQVQAPSPCSLVTVVPRNGNLFAYGTMCTTHKNCSMSLVCGARMLARCKVFSDALHGKDDDFYPHGAADLPDSFVIRCQGFTQGPQRYYGKVAPRDTTASLEPIESFPEEFQAFLQSLYPPMHPLCVRAQRDANGESSFWSTRVVECQTTCACGKPVKADLYVSPSLSTPLSWTNGCDRCDPESTVVVKVDTVRRRKMHAVLWPFAPEMETCDPTTQVRIQHFPLSEERFLELIKDGDVGYASIFFLCFAQPVPRVMYRSLQKKWVVWRGCEQWVSLDNDLPLMYTLFSLLNQYFENAIDAVRQSIAQCERQLESMQGARSKGKESKQLAHERKTLTKRKDDLKSRLGALTTKSKSILRSKFLRNVLTCATILFNDKDITWDRPHLAVPVTNGILRFKEDGSVQLHPPSPMDFVTNVIPTPYDPSTLVGPSRFRQFLEEIFEYDVRPDRAREAMAFVQQYLGAALLRTNRVQKLLFLIGKKGRNGKDILLRVVKDAVGSLCTTFAQDVLLEAGKLGTSAPNPNLMMLKDKCLAFVSELPKKSTLRTSQVKALTGGSSIAARRLQENTIEFTSHAHMVVAGNVLPHFDKSDEAFLARAVVLEFPRRFLSEADLEQDKRNHVANGFPMETYRHKMIDNKLYEKLSSEHRHILAWLLQGTQLFLASGSEIGFPTILRMESNRLLQTSDEIGQFIEECVEFQQGTQTPVDAVYHAYVTWRQEQLILGEILLKIPFSKAFMDRCEKHGVRRTRTSLLRSFLHMKLSQPKSS